MGPTALFAFRVVQYVSLVTLVGAAVLEVVALVNCLTQRADAFPVVGSLSKNTWLAILGGVTILTLLCGLGPAPFSIFAIIGITAAAIYLLDVRPALRDATDGSGNW
jgi:hypothetical protein